MKKLTVSMIGFALLLFAISANAAGLGEPCIADADCNDTVFCNGIESCSSDASICVAGTPVDCGELVCDEIGDTCVECLEDLDCADNGTPYCSDTLECVECRDDADCADGKTCQQGVCAEQAACGLFISPPILVVCKANRPVKHMFTIKGIRGEEGFDPYGAIDFGPFEVLRTFVAGRCGVLKVQILVPAGFTFDADYFDVSVGSCTGKVFLITPPKKEDGHHPKDPKQPKGPKHQGRK